MFGTRHSGASGLHICLEQSILELQGFTHVGNKAFWSCRVSNMIGTEHSGALEQSFLEIQGIKYVWNKAFWSSRASHMRGTNHSGGRGVNYMFGTKHSGAVGCDICITRCGSAA
jgi:hypothetical protein